MPVGVIAAGLSAAGSIGGALLSGHAQTSAAQQATQATTDAQNQATQAQLQLGQQSLDLQRQMYNNNTGLETSIYNQNFGLLSPYASNGMVASNQVNAMLGLPAGPTLTSSVHAPPPIAALSATGTPGNALSGAPSNYAGPDPSQIMAMFNDGISGDGASALAAYNAAHPTAPISH